MAFTEYTQADIGTTTFTPTIAADERLWIHDIEFSSAGLRLEANATGTSGKWVVERCFFNSPPDAMVVTSLGGSIRDVTVRDCYFLDNSTPGVNRFGLNAGAASGEGYKLTIENCYFDGWYNGINFNHAGNWNDIRVVGNQFVNFHNWAARIYHARRAVVAENRVDGSADASNPNSGIWINSQSARVYGNDVQGTGGAGIAMNVGHSSMLSENFTRDNATGLWLTTSKTILVSNSIHRDGIDFDENATYGGTSFANKSPSTVRLSNVVVGEKHYDSAAATRAIGEGRVLTVESGF